MERQVKAVEVMNIRDGRLSRAELLCLRLGVGRVAAAALRETAMAIPVARGW